MKPIKEQDIPDAFKRAVQRLVGDFSEIVQVVRETAEEELKSQQTSNLTAIEDELVEQRKAVLELFKKKRAGEISPTEYDRKYAEYSARIIELESAADTAKSEDHYPIKRVVVFFYLHGVAKSTYRPTHSRKVP